MQNYNSEYSTPGVRVRHVRRQYAKTQVLRGAVLQTKELAAIGLYVKRLGVQTRPQSINSFSHARLVIAEHELWGPGRLFKEGPITAPTPESGP